MSLKTAQKILFKIINNNGTLHIVAKEMTGSSKDHVPYLP
jgi:hypothetical protein